MMAGNPNWWSMNGSMHQQSHHQFHVMYADHQSNSSSNISNNSAAAAADHHHHHHHPDQDFPPVRSWSQLLLGGEEDRFDASLFQQQKKLENWEDQVLLNPLNPSSFTKINHPAHLDHVKQEEINPQSNYHNHHHHHHDSNSNWLHQGIPVSSPTSCITSLSNNFLNFSGAHKAAVTSPAEGKNHLHNQDHSSECNSMSSGGVSKKARVQHSSPQPALKVRKEKLGDRITTLHQLVSPFGKTDTASVLSEAIGYIRFLQGQIEALSSPYMRNASTVHHQHSDSQSREEVKELRSRGLCLVPISCTQNVGNENGADYWAPAALGGGF